MDLVSPYPEGEWIQLDVNRDLKLERSYTELKGEEIPDRILRGPIWNYGNKINSEKEYYYELLYGKQKNTLFTADQLILKGPLWTPSKPVTYSFAKYLLKKMMKVNPDSAALLEVETGRSLNYRQVIDNVKSVASGLQWAGVLPGHVVVVISYNSLEALQVILGAILAGAITAPVDSTLNPMDLAARLRTIQPRLVFTEAGKTLAKVEVALSYLLTLRKPALVVNSRDQTQPHFTFQQLLREVDDDFHPAYQLYNPDNPILILFTSGTTGTSKGAVIAEKMYMNDRLFLENLFSVSSTSYTSLCSASCFWMTTLTSIFIHLTSGNRMVFFRGPTSTAVLIASLRKYDAFTWIPSSTTIFKIANWRTNPRCTHLRSIFFTGKTTTKTNLLRIQNEIFKGKVQLIQFYGMTETGAVASNVLVMNKLGSVGKVLFNTKMKVVEDETGLALGPNQPGEICVWSRTMMQGYYNDPEATEACYDQERFFHTGDIGYYDYDGFVYITGRKKDLIKWRSYHVLPGNVEAKLLAQPAVKEAIVVGLPDDVDGELVTAAIILNSDYEDTDPELLEEIVNYGLSSRMQIRGGIHVFPSFPLTATGKPLRRAVLNMIQSKTDLQY